MSLPLSHSVSSPPVSDCCLQAFEFACLLDLVCHMLEALAGPGYAVDSC